MTDESRPPRRHAWALSVAVAVYVLYTFVVPIIPVNLHGRGYPLAILMCTVAFMWLQLKVAESIGHVRTSARAEAGLAALFGICWFVVLAGIQGHGHLLSAPLFFLKNILLNLCVSLSAGFLGALVSRLIRDKNVLLPVALVAMPIDYLGAMTSIGFTNQVVRHAPAIVQTVSIGVPSLHVGGSHGIHPVSYIGPGDALFMTMFFAVVRRLDLNVRGTFWWMFGLLSAAMIAVLSIRDFNVAALVPMSLAVLAANGSRLRLTRAETFATVYAVLFVVALALAFYLYTSHVMFK